jgi:hypothetical protein
MQTKGKFPISRNSMFFDESMFQMFSEWARDYTETWINQKVVLYQVDYIRTNSDDLYGETNSDEIKYKPPIELPCRYKIDQSTNEAYMKNKNARYKQIGNITAYVFEETLKEYKCDIKYGDLMGVVADHSTLIFFEVFDEGKANFSNKETMFGYKRFYRTIKASAIDESVFNG